MTTQDVLAQMPQPRDRDEPVAMSDFVATTPLADYIAAHERRMREDPDAYFPLGICRHCSTSLGATDEDKVIPVGSFGFLPNVCCRACSDAAKERWALEDRAARDARFMGIIPTRFVNWDDSKGNVHAKNRALSRFSFSSRRGLTIHGQTGTGKTFIAWQIVRRIAEENEANPGKRNYSWAFYDSFELATKGFPADADRVDFLFIDDLGNEPTSTKFETGLLHLLRRRNDWERPIIVTTQLTGVEFKKRFFNGITGEAIMRRFSDLTDKIPTDERPNT